MITWIVLITGIVLLIGIGRREAKRRRLGEVLPDPEPKAERICFRFRA